MAKLIPLKVTADTGQADNAIDRLNQKISKTGKKKSAVGFSDKQFKQYERLLKKQNQITTISAKKRLVTHTTLNKKVIALHKTNQKVHENAEKSKTKITEIQAKTRADIAKEASKRVTHNKKTQDKIQEASEKSKLKVSEIGARKSADAAKEANKRITDSKKTEARIFEAREKGKVRDAENAAKHRRQIARDESLFARRQKQKEADHFLKLEREKDREANRRRGRLPQNVQDTGRGITRIGVAVTTAVTLPIVAATAAILKMGAEYETAMNVFQATTKATEAQMKSAAQEAIKLGNDLTLPGVSAADAGDAMTALAKNAFTVEEAIKASDGTLRLAKATNTEVALSAEFMASAINTFGLAASDSTKIADLYAASANSSAATTSDMAESMKNAGTVMKSSNQSIEDTVTAISLLANAGIRGGDAGTGLKAVMLSLAAPSSKAADAMKALGINVFDAEGKMKALPDILALINKQTAELTQEEKLGAFSQIFGKIGIKTALPLLNQGTEEFNKMKTAVTQVGAANELSAARTKGLAGAWEALKSQLETLGLIIFNKIKGPLTSALVFVSEFIGKLSEGFQSLPTSIQGVILIFTGIVAAIGPVLVIIGTLVTGLGILLSALAPLISLVGAAGLGATLAAIVSAITAALPVIAAIAGVLALVGIAIAATIAYVVFLYAAYKTNFAGIRDFVDETYTTISELITSAINTVTEFVRQRLNQIKAFWETNGKDILEATNKIYKTIEEIIKYYIEGVKIFWTNVGKQILDVVTIIWNHIKIVITNGINIISNIIKLVSAIINGDWKNIWSSIVEITKSYAKILISSAVSMMDLLIQVLTFGFVKLDLAGKFNSLFATTNIAIKKGIKTSKQSLEEGIKSLKESLDEGTKLQFPKTLLNSIKKDIPDAIKIIESGGNTIIEKLTAQREALVKIIENPTASERTKKAATEILTKVKSSIQEEARFIAEEARLAGEKVPENVIAVLKAGETKTKNQTSVLAKKVSGTMKQLKPEIEEAGKQVGRGLIDGLFEGVRSKASDFISYAGNVVRSAVFSMKSAGVIRSPSKLTTLIGEFLGEGLAVGIENKLRRVKKAAKNIIKESLKIFKDSLIELQQLMSLTPQQISIFSANTKIKESITNLKNIIKLREELGVNTNKVLPQNTQAITSELNYLKGLKNVMKEISDQIIKDEKDRIAHAKKLAEAKKDIISSGADEVLKLKEETLTLRATTELEKLKIAQQYELIRLRKTLNASGDFSPEEIEKLIALQIIANKQTQVAQKSLDKRTQVNAGENLAGDLESQLGLLRQVNVEQTIYQETLAKINAEMPNISKGQKERILGIAGQIDALNKLNQQYDTFKGRIRQGLDALLNNDIKGFFSSIFDEFKNLLSDMLTEMITSKLFKLFTGQSAPGGGGGGGIGGLFGNLLGGVKKLFGLGGAVSSAASSGAAAVGGVASSAGGAAASSLAAASSAAGTAAELGGTAAASSLAAASSGAGTAAELGGTAAGSGGLLGSLSGLFTNPWTAVAAGAAIGGFFLFKKLLGSGTLKKLRKAAESTYGIKVKDKSILKQLKVIGEGYFGKGKAGKNATSTVQTYEGKELLRNYAESTGQDTKKLIDLEQFKDKDFSGNQFSTAEFDGFRAKGGAAFAGKAIVVGDGGEPELFIPNTNGKIVPESQLGGSQEMTSSAEMIMLAAEMLVAKISSMPAGEVLRKAIDEDPDVLSDGIDDTLSKNPTTIENIKRNLFEGRD